MKLSLIASGLHIRTGAVDWCRADIGTTRRKTDAFVPDDWVG
jgi:hypothetical protein